jgi:hypothetical protein
MSEAALAKDDPIQKIPTKNLAEALHEFNYMCPSIYKDEKVEVKMQGGGSYSYDYASFGNMVQTIKGSLYRCGLSYSFPTFTDKFVCRVKHVSGEFQDAEIKMPELKAKMQENGSNLTFLMRYTLKLALGLDVDKDDDAANEGDKDPKIVIPKEHIKDVGHFIKTKGKDIENYIVKVGKFKGKKLSTLDHLDLQQYLTWLSSKSKENKQTFTGEWLEFYKIAEAYLQGDNGNT